MKPGGIVTEAGAANAWIVTKDKTLVTHPLTNEILGGVTRSTVMRMAKAAGYQIQERAFTLDEALAAKEMFLTGTTTFVLPVVQVDEQTIANGAPGSVSLDLRQRYSDYVNALDDSAWSIAIP